MKKRILTSCILALLIALPVGAYDLSLLDRLGLDNTTVREVKIVNCTHGLSEEYWGCASHTADGSKRDIQIKSTLSEMEKKYTFLHEVGHLVTHFDPQARKVFPDSEDAADAFAYYMLGIQLPHGEYVLLHNLTNQLLLTHANNTNTAPLCQEQERKSVRSRPSCPRCPQYIRGHHNSGTRVGIEDVWEWIRNHPNNPRS